MDYRNPDTVNNKMQTWSKCFSVLILYLPPFSCTGFRIVNNGACSEKVSEHLLSILLEEDGYEKKILTLHIYFYGNSPDFLQALSLVLSNKIKSLRVFPP